LSAAILASIVVAGCLAASTPNATDLASPTASNASPSPAISVGPPSPSTSTEAWTLVGELEAYEAFGDSWVTGFEGGYVAIGSAAANGAATAWVSVDGRTWAGVALPAPNSVIDPARPTMDPLTAYPTVVTSDGATVVIVGGYPHEPCQWIDRSQGDVGGGGPECPISPISWVSEDGLTWRSSLPWVGPVGRPAEASDPYGGFHQGSQFSSVAKVPDGWEAALFFWNGEGTFQREIWHSSDELAWEWRATVFNNVGYDYSREIMVDPVGRRVISANRNAGAPHEIGPARLWSSSDGITWTDLPASGEIAMITGGVAPQQPEDPWLIRGQACTRLADNYGNCRPDIWASRDLKDWQAPHLPGLADFTFGEVDVLRSDRGYIAIGSSGYRFVGPQLQATWLSTDGIAWTALPDAPLIVAIADGPAGVIGFGDTSGDKIAVYQLR
jgi:hypothetical protein